MADDSVRSCNVWSLIRRLKFPELESDDPAIKPWVILPRTFIWNEEQIAKLFDSIMRGFPIGTFLIWRTDAAVVYQNLVAQWSDSTTVSGEGLLQHNGAKDIILDGQQRLQSLIIGLAGSYNGREMYFDVTSGDAISPDDIRYCFGFKDAQAGWPWVRFKDVLGELSSDRSTPALGQIGLSAAMSGAGSVVERKKIAGNLMLALVRFQKHVNINYQLVFRNNYERFRGASSMYAMEEAAEIFKRANACGTAPDRFVVSLA